MRCLLRKFLQFFRDCTHQILKNDHLHGQVVGEGRWEDSGAASGHGTFGEPLEMTVKLRTCIFLRPFVCKQPVWQIEKMSWMSKYWLILWFTVVAKCTRVLLSLDKSVVSWTWMTELWNMDFFLWNPNHSHPPILSVYPSCMRFDIVENIRIGPIVVWQLSYLALALLDLDDNCQSPGGCCSNELLPYIIDIDDNIIKWPMPLGARPRSIKNVNKIL